MAEAAEQGTEAWRVERAGLITASEFATVLKPGKEREKYKLQLVFERRSRKPVHEIGSKSMAWGKDLEAYAREAVQLETGHFIERSGLIRHSKYPFIACSPDGLIGTDGGWESKSPHDEAVHLRTIFDGMPEDHDGQVQGNLFVSCRKWWLFSSFDPRQCEEDRLYTQVIQRDEAYIKKLEIALVQFEMEIRSLIRVLENRHERVTS